MNSSLVLLAAWLWVVVKALVISFGIAAVRDTTVSAYPTHLQLINILAVLAYAPALSYLVLRPAFALLERQGLYPRRRS